MSDQDLYDMATGQEPVLSYDEVDRMLANFESVHFNKLDKKYVKDSKSKGKYLSRLKNKTYRVVHGRDVFRFAVGKIRIKDLLARDEVYHKNLEELDSNHAQYWLIDKKLLYRHVDLMIALDKLGYDKYGYSINHGHRHPAYNEKIGGAEFSRHLQGQAVDLQIKDINKDEKITQEDKTIVLDLLEHQIIGNKGGIGRYPGSMVIHYDVRGYRGRWDHMKKKKKKK